MKLQQVVEKRPSEGALFIHKAISSELRLLNYPEDSIASMERCGHFTGELLFRECGCDVSPVRIVHNCNLRTCPRCSLRRKSRIFSRFMPFFRKYPVTRSHFFQFLTISPPNYVDLEHGLKDIKKNFSKFLNSPYSTSRNFRGHLVVDEYVKDRIKAGFYVIETKQKPDGWNIHIHAVLYGRWIDYRLRGRCLACGQNLIKFDKFSRVFYCGNRKCNSSHVVRYQDTKVSRIWRNISGKSVHVYGERVARFHGAVGYLTKYISINKDDFLDVKGFAKYIFCTRRKKLISAFGMFYNHKISKPIYYCNICEARVFYFFDLELSHFYKQRMKLPPPEAQKRLTQGFAGRF